MVKGVMIVRVVKMVIKVVMNGDGCDGESSDGGWTDKTGIDGGCTDSESGKNGYDCDRTDDGSSDKTGINDWN